jgi:hypothetical protein
MSKDVRHPEPGLKINVTVVEWNCVQKKNLLLLSRPSMSAWRLK